MSAYGSFAGIYDALMDDVDYDGWARYYLDLIARAGVAPRTLCDCACGTGSMAVRFADRDLRVTGVDISEDMLQIAREKARSHGVQVMFVHQDMCRLALPSADTSWPSTWMLPVWYCSRPLMQRSSVDLPAPLWPMMP